MNKKSVLNVLIVIFAILTLLIVGYIFSNSFDSVEESSEKSSEIASILQKIFDPYQKIPEDVFHNLIRKIAHLTEFGVLGVSVGILFLLIFYRTNKIFKITPPAFCICVGATDEIIQKFTARGNQITDVLIDATGACLGLAFVALVAFLIHKKKNKI